MQKVKKEENIKQKEREKVQRRDKMIYIIQTALKSHKLFYTVQNNLWPSD